MKNHAPPTYYDPFEEKLNVFSHGFGILLSLVATFLLIHKAGRFDDFYQSLSLIVFGISLVALYTASTLFHAAKDLKKRLYLNIFDHAAIYVLIAGTYSPISLMAVGGEKGWWVFMITWLLALLGVVFKLFFTGRFDTISTILYVLMGWLIVLVLRSLIEGLGGQGTLWLVVGGISYTIGAIIFSLPKIKYNHAIFHLFVLGGSLAHFICIYYYIVPN